MSEMQAYWLQEALLNLDTLSKVKSRLAQIILSPPHLDYRYFLIFWTHLNNNKNRSECFFNAHMDYLYSKKHYSLFFCIRSTEKIKSIIHGSSFLVRFGQTLYDGKCRMEKMAVEWNKHGDIDKSREIHTS